jgi:hypothetical protein
MSRQWPDWVVDESPALNIHGCEAPVDEVARFFSPCNMHATAMVVGDVNGAVRTVAMCPDHAMKYRDAGMTIQNVADWVNDRGFYEAQLAAMAAYDEAKTVEARAAVKFPDATNEPQYGRYITSLEDGTKHPILFWRDSLNRLQCMIGKDKRIRDEAAIVHHWRYANQRAISKDGYEACLADPSLLVPRNKPAAAPTSDGLARPNIAPGESAQPGEDPHAWIFRAIADYTARAELITTIKDDDTAAAALTVINLLNGSTKGHTARKEADRAYEAEVDSLRQQVKNVQDKWRPARGDADQVKDALNARYNAFLTARAKAARAEQARLDEEVRQANVRRLAEVLEQQQAAEAKAAAENKPPPPPPEPPPMVVAPTVVTRTIVPEVGRKASQQEEEVITDFDKEKIWPHIKNNADLRAFLLGSGEGKKKVVGLLSKLKKAGIDFGDAVTTDMQVRR